MISIERLNSLRAILSNLNEKKVVKEKKRQEFYNSIQNHLLVLKRPISLTYDEKICYLEKLAHNLETEILDRKNKLVEIILNIRKGEEYLQLDPKELLYDLDDYNFIQLEKYLNYLIKEQNDHFDQIFDNTFKTLSELNKIFGISTAEYTRDKQSLDTIKANIIDLAPKKELFSEIIDLIDRRKLLLEKMTEF